MVTTLPSIDDINTAANRIAGLVHKTPLLGCETINAFFQAEILFKCENFQKVGAFKSRGACNAVFSLPEDQLSRGVGTHSSGNHAQALARAAALRNTTAYIVMPETAPNVKVEAVKHYGGKITFCKPTLESREQTLAEIIKETGAVEIHPYNDYRIIAGQATATVEILKETGDLDIIMAPVGGGGLLSGTALAASYLAPKTRVIAAEPEMANDAYRSFHEGRFIPSENPQTIADGLLTSLGSLTYPIIIEYVDDIVTVSENGIIEAMRLIWERMKIIVEPSAAVPLGSLLEGKVDIKNKRVVIILSGGNVNLEKLPWIK
jgi:threonine dehydratase